MYLEPLRVSVLNSVVGIEIERNLLSTKDKMNKYVNNEIELANQNINIDLPNSVAVDPCVDGGLSWGVDMLPAFE